MFSGCTMRLWNVHPWSCSNPDRNEPVQLALTDLALSYMMSCMILRSTFQPKQFWQPDTRRKNSVNRTLLVDMYSYNKTYNFILRHEKEQPLQSHSTRSNKNWQCFSVLLLQNCSKDINLKDSSNFNMKEAEYDSSGIIKLRQKSRTNPRSLRQQCI